MRGQEYLNPEQCRILRKKLRYLNLTQKELANKINVSQALFSHIARGQQPCTAEQRKILEKVLDLKSDSLSPAISIQTHEQEIQTLVELLQRQEQEIQTILESLKILTVYAKHTTERLNALEKSMKEHYSDEEPHFDMRPMYYVNRFHQR
jgi:predicted transcriptional regulator